MSQGREGRDPIALLEMDPYQFENIILRLLQNMGLAVEATQRTSDGGVDIRARSHDPITGGLFLVQCKRYSGTNHVGVIAIRELYGVVTSERAGKGIVVTTSDFTKQAREFADGKPIELINGSRLHALLTKYQLVEPLPDDYMLHTLDPHPWLRSLDRSLTEMCAQVHRVLARQCKSFGAKKLDVAGFAELLEKWWDSIYNASDHSFFPHNCIPFSPNIAGWGSSAVERDG